MDRLRQLLTTKLRPKWHKIPDEEDSESELMLSSKLSSPIPEKSPRKPASKQEDRENRPPQQQTTRFQGKLVDDEIPLIKL